MHTDLDALVTALYVRVDDFLPRWRGRGRPPRISDAELITVAVAQMFLRLYERPGVPRGRWLATRAFVSVSAEAARL